MSPPAAYSFAVVCEAAADRDLSIGLADRVLCQQIDWIDSESLDLYRHWRGMTEAQSQMEWDWVKKLVQEQNIRAHGHFQGNPGVLDAALVGKALLILARLPRLPDAVVLFHDTEGREERRQGFEQARNVAHWPFEIVLAIPHSKRECWVLAGFDPQSESEKAALDGLRQELGFDPRVHAERLTAAKPHAKRNAKRVLGVLLGGLPDREDSCWRECDLRTLSERGRGSGLADYLEEVRTRLVPLFAGRPGEH